MKLTAQQIERLYTFTRQHYVEWYDLQSELVDHLANAIEQEWEQNPNRTFDEILNKEFRKFGIFGFMDLVEERQKVLRKKYLKIIGSHLKNFFTLPKILFTITATILVFDVFRRFELSSGFAIILYILLLLFAFFRIIMTKFKRKQKVHSQQNKWMFEEIINQYGGIGSFIAIPMNLALQFVNHKENFLNEMVINGFMSILLVLTSLFLYIMFFLIPSKSKEYLAQTYPEYSLQKM